MNSGDNRRVRLGQRVADLRRHQWLRHNITPSIRSREFLLFVRRTAWLRLPSEADVAAKLTGGAGGQRRCGQRITSATRWISSMASVAGFRTTSWTPRSVNAATAL